LCNDTNVQIQDGKAQVTTSFCGVVAPVLEGCGCGKVRTQPIYKRVLKYTLFADNKYSRISIIRRGFYPRIPMDTNIFAIPTCETLLLNKQRKTRVRKTKISISSMLVSEYFPSFGLF